MNDRFRFRAWNKEEKQLYYDAEDTYDCLAGKPYPIGASYFGCLLYNENWIVEQCTGLKDKNGKLIYEGDILKCVHSDIMKYKIYWGRSCWRMKVYGTDNEIVDDAHLFLDTATLEVIGNIHENKELLDE